MEKKTITVQTNTVKKGRLDQRSFSCLYYEGDGVRMYMLDYNGPLVKTIFEKNIVKM